MATRRHRLEEKWILHVDFDSFFASVEQQANPEYRNRPLSVVGGVGDTIVESATVVASSKEAKKFGIRTGYRVFEARKKCPGMIFVNPSFGKYTSTHDKWRNIVSAFSPTIEVFSVDEAFLDITHWIETWKYTPEKVGKMLKERIRAQLGDIITSSVGIAQNRTMAKLATGFGKPDGLTVLHRHEYAKALKSIRPHKICGIGPRLTRRLSALGVTTAWDIGKIPEYKLRKHFGIYGSVLHQMGTGTHFQELATEKEFPKSIGHSKVLAKTMKGDEARFVLRELCDMVAYRARKHKAKGNVIAAAATEPDITNPRYHRFGRSSKIDDHTSNGYKIFEEASRLIAGSLESGTRFLAVTMSGIVHENAYTLSFLNQETKMHKALQAMDLVRSKHGHRVIGMKGGI